MATKQAQFHQYVRSIEGQQVMVIGDIMFDRFVYGDVKRISPESPVPVLTIAREENMLGGAGNVVANLAGLKARPFVISVIGNDQEGEIVRDKLKDLGQTDAGLIVSQERPTIIKTRFLASNQQLLRADVEKTHPIPQDIQDRAIEVVRSHIDDMGAIIISDYGKGMLQDALIQAIIELARAKSIPILVDPKGSDYSRYRGASVVTPNRDELTGATGMATETDTDIEAATVALLAQSGIEAVIATRSQDGMTVHTSGQGHIHMPTKALEVFDVSGAGDTVIATIGAALACGCELENAAALANIAGGIVVAKVGTAMIRSDDMLSRISEMGDIKYQDIDRLYSAPCVSWDEAAEHMERWRARGFRVGFTNGCFDIMHSGHTVYLNDARSMCDRLVVGLNCDDSIKRLKGDERPINDEQCRAAVLGSLGSVDLVILFGAEKSEDDNPLELLRRVKPDLLIKGGDYESLDEIVGHEFVKSYGGDVRLSKLVPQKSTSDVIRKVKES